MTAEEWDHKRVALTMPKLKPGQHRCRLKCDGCDDLCGKKYGHSRACLFYPKRLFRSPPKKATT